MKELTAKQLAIFEMRKSVEVGGRGLRLEEIARELGISTPVVSKAIGVICRKLGLKRGERPWEERGGVRDEDHAEKVAGAIDAAADVVSKTQREAIERVNESLKAAGVPDRISDATVRRMLVKYAGVVTVKKQINTSEILKTIDEELDLISSYIDDQVVSQASLRDLAMSKAALIEKRALLRGEPTQIISDLERRKLTELLPLLTHEMARRGITVEGVAERVDEVKEVVPVDAKETA
ncbi:MAG: hypothetical protein U1E51_07690 [Candidatus Binatia bacterium]|nr:hypothetical protein [Candidatus Binatia bacterium]